MKNTTQDTKNVGGEKPTIASPVDSNPEKPPVQQEDTVVVPKTLIEQILANQNKLEEKLAEKDKQIDQLMYAADKARMGIYESRNNTEELIRTFGVGFWNLFNEKTGTTTQHIIRGTKLIYQDVAIEDNGGVRRLVEKQILKVFLDNGVDASGADKEFIEIEVPYVEFYRALIRKRFPQVRESKSADGEFRTLRLDDGREIEFDINFLNY